MKYIFLPLAILTLIGCKTSVENIESTDVELKELDYSLVEDRQIKWQEVLSQSKSRYMVYFYSEYCAYCNQIKQDVLSYYLENIDEMYFVDAIQEKAIYKTNDGMLIGTKTIEDFYIFGTPFLAEITSNTVTNWYAGVDSIKLYINLRLDNKK